MPKRLTDQGVAGLREKAGNGADRADLAAEFGVTPRHVARLVRGDQRQTIPAQDGPALAAVRAFLEGLELDDADRVLAAGAETLAAKLDAVRVADSAASANAAPALSGSCRRRCGRFAVSTGRHRRAEADA